MSLRAVNLNLIPVLQALLREQSISRAAEVLHLTQPAVSAALARLRIVMNDPLLVPVGRGMELTSRARALIQPVEEACASLGLLLAPPQFDPYTAERTFSISASDYGVALLAPRMMKALASQAPGVSMHFIHQSMESAAKHRTGEVDLMFLPRVLCDALDYGEVRVMPLFRDEFVRVIGPGHPLHGVRKPTKRQLASHRQVVFSPWHAPSVVASAMLPFAETFGVSALGSKINRQDSIKVEHFNMLPLLALLTDSMVLAPRRLIELLQPYMPLSIIGAPLASLELCVAWSPVHETDPAHRWFRELLRATVG